MTLESKFFDRQISSWVGDDSESLVLIFFSFRLIFFNFYLYIFALSALSAE